MAFGHGKNSIVMMSGYDLSCYLNTLSTPQSADTVETTVFCSSAKEYIPGNKDATLSAEGFYDGTPGAVDDILSSAHGTSENVWVWYPQGATLNNYGYGLETINNSYEITTPVDGVVSISMEGQSYVGKDRIQSHHSLVQETTSGTETSIDGTASSTKGGIGYVEITSNSCGVSATIKIQHSNNNSTFDDLISFTASTAVTGERLQSTGNTVKQYTRASWTFASSAPVTFNVGFRRK
jgi:hypothetical protein